MDESIEVCVVEIFVGSISYYIIGVYRPPNGVLNNFQNKLNEILLDSKIKNKFCIVLGDMNINLLNTDNNTQDYINSMNTLHLFPTINKPTRITEDSATIIDHIFINKPTNYTSGIILDNTTDHMPTFIRIPVNKKSFNSNKVKITFRQTNDPDSKLRFKQNLNNFNWSTIKTDDAEQYMNSFITTLDDIFCKSFPLKSKYLSQKAFANPWVTSKIRKVLQIKSNFYDLYRKNIISKESNNSIKNKVNSIIDKTKKNYYKNQFEKHKNNMAKTWKIIRTLTTGCTSKQSKYTLIQNNKQIINNLEIAEIFNDYFSSVAEELDNNLTNSIVDPLIFVKENKLASIRFSKVTEEEVIKLINELKHTKVGKDEITIEILKDNKNFIAHVFTDIINLCVKKSIFPNSLKCAIITPLLKGGCPFDHTNYRPISIFKLFCKVFERCIYNRMVAFLLEFNILTPRQHGFLKGCSTETAVTSLTEYLHQSLNSKNTIINIFIDLRKAFDTVNHQILLKKLEKYGIRNQALEFLKNYLTGRTQRVRIGTDISTPRPITIGLQQGTCLAPLLFLLYVNDLPNFTDDVFPVLYADDTTLSFRGLNTLDVTQKTNSALQKFNEWTLSNRLSINTDKTFAIIVTNNLTNLPQNIQINSNPINIQNAGKFLGIILDSQLKFKNHISYICKKVSKAIGILFVLQKYLTTSALIPLYYTFIYPHLLYCNLAWGNTYKSHLKPLFLLQKKAIRIVNKTAYISHTNNLFYSNKILKLEDINKFRLGCYMFENNHETFARSHNYNTRNRTTLLPHFQRTTTTQHALNYEGPRLWNTLPLNIRTIQSKTIFKKCLKEYLVSVYETVTQNSIDIDI